MGSQRKTWSTDVKEAIVLSVLRGELEVAEAACQYGANASLIHTWKTQFLEAGRARVVLARPAPTRTLRRLGRTAPVLGLPASQATVETKAWPPWNKKTTISSASWPRRNWRFRLGCQAVRGCSHPVRDIGLMTVFLAQLGESGRRPVDSAGRVERWVDRHPLADHLPLEIAYLVPSWGLGSFAVQSA